MKYSKILTHRPLRRLLYAGMIACLLFLNGCFHYGFTGASIPKGVHTVYIPFFANQSSSSISNISNKLNQALVDRFIKKSPLHLANNNLPALYQILVTSSIRLWLIVLLKKARYTWPITEAMLTLFWKDQSMNSAISHSVLTGIIKQVKTKSQYRFKPRFSIPRRKRRNGAIRLLVVLQPTTRMIIPYRVRMMLLSRRWIKLPIICSIRQ